MRISIAKHAGFCVGVKKAITLALKTAEEKANVYMLGDIVHNETVTKEIEETGIKRIKRLGAGKNKNLLIRAHGAAKNTYKEARKKGYKVIDATCPMVKEIHKIAIAAEKKGFTVIIVGTKKHDEVKGIAGQLKKKPVVIETFKESRDKGLKRIKKAYVVVQSTQNIEKVAKIVKSLTSLIPEVKFKNTICRPTFLRQDEAKKMPVKNDVMLVVGSKTSANTKRLFEISKKLNKNTYWIQTENNIKTVWLKKVEKIGILAGASTPDSTIRSIKKFLRNISNT